MRATRLTRSDYRRMRWKNDRGWTSEVAISPRDADFASGAFDWRLSVAEVEADSEFSPLPGIDRTIALLEGAGMVLASPQGEAVLERRGQMHAFRGDDAVSCRLVGGACRDFNVMVRRGAVAAKVLFRPLVGPMVFFDEPGATWAIHVVGGHARLQNTTTPMELAQGDTLMLEPGEPDVRQRVLDGGGELLLVRLDAAG